MSLSYTDFVDRFHAHVTADPNVRVELGVDRDLGELPDPSMQAVQDRVARARALRADLEELSSEGLSFDDALDLELAALQLDLAIHRDTLTFNGTTTHPQMPKASTEIGDPILTILAQDPRPAHARLEDITARLEQVPRYLDAMLGRMDTPVARWVQMDVRAAGGMSELFDAAKGLAEQSGWADAGRLATAATRAQASLTGYAEALAALPTTTQFALSAEDAQRIVTLQGIDLSLDQLHGIARDFLAETHASLVELRERLAPKYDQPADVPLAALHDVLNARFRVQSDNDGAGVLQRYEVEREQILAFIREQRLFPIPDQQDMKIQKTPSFLEPTIPAGAMFPPTPFREGVRTSLVYLTLNEGMLDGHTDLTIPNMMMHEGIPGHHLQLATASMHRSVIRRHYQSSAHAEGWTTMLEDYMLDRGYMGELTDEARYCAKRDISRIGARVVIDLFFMTGDRRYLDVGVPCDVSSADPFEAAGALLHAVTGFAPGRVQGELSWYSQERGYPLSYLVGNQLVWRLKRDLDAANPQARGIELDRRFHRLYLESGNMPLPMLRRVFKNEGLL